EAELEAVGKACRGIDHDRRGIDLAQEAHGPLVVAGDDGIGMRRAVAGDVRDGFVQAFDDADRDDRREVLRGPALLGRETGATAGAIAAATSSVSMVLQGE